MKNLIVLGIRGVPAAHGGFETFAERLSLYLISQGWRVTVYCQEEGEGVISESTWKGVRRVHVPVSQKGALGTIVFDWRAAMHAVGQSGLVLTLGYNTAVFNILQRFKGQINIINMDGIEWRRDKWGRVAKTWFWLNERIGCWVGNHLVADHPKISEHLATRVTQNKITMIPYGADEVVCANESILKSFDVERQKFSVIIARPEPENSILEMVRAFSARKRDHKLVVFGKFSPDTSEFHRQIMNSASAEVVFIGAIYDAQIVSALRFFSRFYLHGHRVGGTNPSLVEAMGAGCAIIAHDNHFNRWVAGPDAYYFDDESSCEKLFDLLLKDDLALAQMRAGSTAQFNERFTWPDILKSYEELLERWHP